MGVLTNRLKAGGAAVRVSFQFEEGRGYSPSTIESAARAAQLAIQQNPLMAAHYPFFEASKAADWFCGKAFLPTNGMNNGLSDGKKRRLRAISFGSETLLEHSYGGDGRMTSTRYHGGETVFYEWDDLTRTRRLRSASGRQTVVKLRPDDLPESITYDNIIGFHYEYDINGNITRIVFPDAVRMERTFNKRGDLDTMNCAGVVTKIRWKPSGQFEGYSLLNGQSKFEFHAEARKHNCDLGLTSAPPAQSFFPVVHPLGAWRMAGQAALQEMLTPWGGRFRIHASTQGRPSIVWTSAGQECFAYGRDGSLASILHPDGSYSVCYSPNDKRQAVLVHPTGVTLLQFDGSGHLRKTLSQNGDYTALDYAGDGSLKRVKSPVETIGIFEANGSCWIVTPTGYSCSLEFSSSGNLNVLIAKGLQKNTADELCKLLAFLWRWLGLRTAFSIAMGRNSI